MATDPYPLAYLHQSRYQIGDVVFGLRIYPRKYWSLCGVCGGTGRVAVVCQEEGHEEVTTYCPDRKCSSGKVLLQQGSYFGIEQLTLGMLRVQAGFDPHVEYMAHETGVGSGQVWKEETLFPTPEDAEAVARGQGAVMEKELQV